jgi:cold shock CspA family protein
MNGKITTWFADKGFGFIKDENGENRYFHVVKVSNPELVAKDAEVTFEPTTNNKGLSCYAVKVLPKSKYIHIAGERIKITSIKAYQEYSEQVDADSKVDKDNAVLSVGLLMNRIKPKPQASTTRTLRKLSITTFSGDVFHFSEQEIDIDETLQTLKKISVGVKSARS